MKLVLFVAKVKEFEMASVTMKYIGQKVSKVRWSPAGPLKESNTFITGGWDDQVNKLSIWSLEEKSNDNDYIMGDDLPDEPCLVSQCDHEGSVTDLKYFDSERFLSSSSNGSVVAYKKCVQTNDLRPVQSWRNVHNYGLKNCSCTGLATNLNLPDFVSIGEDGRLVVLRMDNKAPVRTIDTADCTTILAATFVTSYEVATVNFIGQLKVWDLRQKAEKPVRVMLLSGDRVPLFCIDKHSTQPHLIATGGQDGVLALWDMRQDQYPVTLLEAHSAAIWEVKFHESNPDHLFTCSQDGSVWHWNGSSMKTPAMNVNHLLNPNQLNIDSDSSVHDTTTPWLSADATKHKIETFSLIPYNRLPVNSLDVTSGNLVCGTDGEAVYTVRGLDIQ